MCSLKIHGRNFGYVILALIYAALLLNCNRCFPGYVQSSSPRVEALAGLFLLLPWLLLPIANIRLLFKTPHSTKRLWTAALLLPVSLAPASLSIVVAYISFDTFRQRMRTNKEEPAGLWDVSLRPLPDTITVGDHQIRAYELPGNVLGASSVVIRREQPLALGLSWITPLHFQDNAQTVKMTVRNHQVHCTFPDSPSNLVVLLPLH